MITLENNRLHALITDKDALVNSGRKISRDIDGIDIKIKRFQEREKRITAKVIPPKALTDRGDEITRQLNELAKELEKISNEVTDAKLAAIPSDVKEQHQKLLADKEKCERERNKIALKIQKIKDKIIPIVQKEVKPFLKDEFDDIETARATPDGKVTITTFNHLEDYKSKFRK